MDVEGAEGVLVVRRHENHVHLAANEIENFEPIQARHLDIEEDQVRLLLGDGLYGFKSVRALAGMPTMSWPDDYCRGNPFSSTLIRF